MTHFLRRPERLRQSSALRHLVAETSLNPAQLVWPLFLSEQASGHQPISSMPGVFQWSLEDSFSAIEQALAKGVQHYILFGVVPPAKKDSKGSEAWNDDSLVVRALGAYRKRFGKAVTLWADACFCEYTDHGHCGEFKESHGSFVRQQEATVLNLQKAGVIYAQAGADVIAPSGMLDGMIQSLREALDRAHFSDRLLCSYAVKYASSFYGPFRDAADNAPRAGTDRKAYQMDPRNRREAWREAMLDVEQGADLLMVKPGLPYLDVISDLSAKTTLPVGAYQVSGEYAMVEAAAARGWVDRQAVILESLTSLRRAGAQFILTYWASEVAGWLRS